jgi:hypothetical protein
MNTSRSCTHNDYSHKHVCPVNGRINAPVNRRTILHLIKSSWTRQIPEQGYYFAPTRIVTLFISARMGVS